MSQIRPFSVIIHTKNASETIERAIRSVAWAAEIVVVDMHSTDNTVETAQHAGAKIVSVKDVGFADPMRNFGLQQATHEWILVLDADEVAPPGYETLLQELMIRDPQAYYLPRKNVIFDKWMRHTNWWPDYQLRFFPRGSVSWSEKVHTLPTASIPTAQVEAVEDNAIVHYNYTDISSFIDRMNRYTTIEAIQRTDSHDPLTVFKDEFIKRYFAGEGYQDGTHGMYLSVLQACYEFVVSLKQWEHAGRPEHNLAALNWKQWQKELKYWLADYQYRQSKSGLSRLWWRLRRKLKV